MAVEMIEDMFVAAEEEAAVAESVKVDSVVCDGSTDDVNGVRDADVEVFGLESDVVGVMDVDAECESEDMKN